MIWLVSWSIVITVTCWTGPQQSPYGELPKAVSGSYDYQKSLRYYMKRWFATKEEAEKFVKDAPLPILKTMKIQSFSFDDLEIKVKEKTSEELSKGAP